MLYEFHERPSYLIIRRNIVPEESQIKFIFVSMQMVDEWGRNEIVNRQREVQATYWTFQNLSFISAKCLEDTLI